MKKIYLDNNATTCLAKEVIVFLKEEIEVGYGNPSSIHSFGQEARNKLTKARRQIADFLGIKPSELIFTSGGTESANMILRGLSPGHLITSSVEHSCVFKTASLWPDVTFLQTGPYGAVTAEQVEQAIKPTTRLIALMAVNNETGVKTDIQAIAKVAERHSIPFFVDAVALIGKEPFSFPNGVSAFSFSGHKFHALKGVGGLAVRSSLKWASLITGGEQEMGKRGGTENMLGILSLAKACTLAPSASIERLRNQFESLIQNALPDVFINGEGPRIGNTSNLSFLGVDGESLLMNLDLHGIAASHGSACSSGSLEPSRILLNMGLSHARAESSIRFSLSRFTTEEEILEAAETIIKLVRLMR